MPYESVHRNPNAVQIVWRILTASVSEPNRRVPGRSSTLRPGSGSLMLAVRMRTDSRCEALVVPAQFWLRPPLPDGRARTTEQTAYPLTAPSIMPWMMLFCATA